MNIIGVRNRRDLQGKGTVKNLKANKIKKMINEAFKNTEKLTKI